MLIIDFLSNSWTDIKYATARGKEENYTLCKYNFINETLEIFVALLIHERNVLNFLFAYKTYPPKYFHFGPKIRSLTESQ